MAKLSKDKEEIFDNREREGNRVSVPRVIIALVISASVLALAFFGGYMVSFLNYQKVTNLQDTIKVDLLTNQISTDFLQECNDDAFNFFSGQLDKTGSLISILEDRFGKTDPNVLEQKKQYSLLEAQHFLAVRDYASRCNESINTILFFYSNDKKYGDEAEKVGKILNNVKDQKRSKIMIYSFDYDLNSDIIGLLKTLYSVDSPNVVVVDGKIVLKGVSDVNDILKVLS